MHSLRLALGLAGAALLFPLALVLILPSLRPDARVDRTLVSNQAAEPVGGVDWLSITDKRSPAEWLAERAASQGGTAMDVAGFDALLRVIAPIYQETPRMIANRVAQIETEMKGDPDAATLLVDLNRPSDRRRSLSEIAQHYLILRREGFDHAAALEGPRDKSGFEGE